MWDKEDGLQCHTVIQSFDDCDGLTPQRANELGRETARRLAPGHQAVVFTHTDGKGGKTHNHIVINAVSVQDGKKLNTRGFLNDARRVSNEISRENGLHVITERTRGTRFTQAEQGLADRGVQSWKDELREVVEVARDSCRSMEQFRTKLEGYGVRISERTRKRDGETGWTYQHPNGMKCRAAKLGEDYTPQAIARTMAQQPQREPQQEQARPTSYSVVVEEAQQDKAAQEEARRALEKAALEHQKSTKKRDQGYSRGR